MIRKIIRFKEAKPDELLKMMEIIGNSDTILTNNEAEIVNTPITPEELIKDNMKLIEKIIQARFTQIPPTTTIKEGFRCSTKK